jgi:hypothetical protein
MYQFYAVKKSINLIEFLAILLSKIYEQIRLQVA